MKGPRPCDDVTKTASTIRENFRQQYNLKNKSAAAVAKAGCNNWNSLNDKEKAPFVATAKKRKEEYERNIEAYNRKLVLPRDDKSEKSKSETNDEDGEGGGEPTTSLNPVTTCRRFHLEGIMLEDAYFGVGFVGEEYPEGAY